MAATGVLLHVTEDLLRRVWGRHAGCRPLVWPPVPAVHVGAPGGGRLGPGALPYRAQGTHVLFEAVILRAFGVVLPNICGVLLRLPSAPRQAVSVGPS